MYDISYADMPRHLADDKAIDDLRNYIGDEKYAMFRKVADQTTDVNDWHSINGGEYDRFRHAIGHPAEIRVII